MTPLTPKEQQTDPRVQQEVVNKNAYVIFYKRRCLPWSLDMIVLGMMEGIVREEARKEKAERERLIQIEEERKRKQELIEKIIKESRLQSQQDEEKQQISDESQTILPTNPENNTPKSEEMSAKNKNSSTSIQQEDTHNQQTDESHTEVNTPSEESEKKQTVELETPPPTQSDGEIQAKDKTETPNIQQDDTVNSLPVQVEREVPAQPNPETPEIEVNPHNQENSTEVTQISNDQITVNENINAA